MRIDYIDGILIVYLKNVSTDNIKELCIDIVNKLNKYFNVDLKGFYTINVYIDNYYGVVMEIETDNDDLYLDYSNIDLHIIPHSNTFLYEVDDILDLNTSKYYTYQGKYYIDINDVSNIEFVKIIYKDTADIIKNMICKDF